LDFIQALFIETNPIPLKYAMNKAGFGVGPARLPLDELSDEGKTAIDALLDEVK
jgi:4-hydroxy-tetrahydrodipicolinate synthase